LYAFVLRLSTLIVLVLVAGQAFADDWNVVRLRGTVLEFIDGNWQPLKRGSIVPDNRVVRTTGNGHATLMRGSETIELAANTQIQIYDEGGGKPFTTVVEHFGTVAVEAEVRNVQHFVVKNQYLAAVVKGTRFTVSATRAGGAVVVQRGHVEVDSTTDHTTTLLSVGQKAKVQKGGMTVSGKGKLPTVLKQGSKSGKSTTDRVAATTAAVEQAEADLEQAKATGDLKAIEAAQDALEDAAEDAAKVAEKAAKADDKAAAKAAADAAKAAKDADKAADKAAKDQAKADEAAVKAAAKAAEEARKAAEKAAEEARKAAEKAAKDAEKAAKDAAKADKSDDDNSGSGSSNSGKGKAKSKSK